MFLECLLAFECDGAAAPNRLLGEGCLSGASSLAILFGAEAEEPAEPAPAEAGGRARANMVLGTFAETKVPRRAGAKPGIQNILERKSHPNLTTVKLGWRLTGRLARAQPAFERFLTLAGRFARPQILNANIFIQVWPMNSLTPTYEPPIITFLG